ncbi:Uncharacterised protein [Streptococcus pneumoniae]|nr:Uncharacterised protein [Streptococcus pneumoniae]
MKEPVAPPAGASAPVAVAFVVASLVKPRVAESAFAVMFTEADEPLFEDSIVNPLPSSVFATLKVSPPFDVPSYTASISLCNACTKSSIATCVPEPSRPSTFVRDTAFPFKVILVAEMSELSSAETSLPSNFGAVAAAGVPPLVTADDLPPSNTFFVLNSVVFAIRLTSDVNWLISF